MNACRANAAMMQNAALFSCIPIGRGRQLNHLCRPCGTAAHIDRQTTKGYVSIVQTVDQMRRCPVAENRTERIPAVFSVSSCKPMSYNNEAEFHNLS